MAQSGLTSVLHDVAYGKVGPRLALVRRVNLVVRDLATGKERVIVKDGHLSAAFWSPDGKTLAVGTHTSLTLHDVATGKCSYQPKLRDVHDDLYAHAPTASTRRSTVTGSCMCST